MQRATRTIHLEAQSSLTSRQKQRIQLLAGCRLLIVKCLLLIMDFQLLTFDYQLLIIECRFVDFLLLIKCNIIFEEWIHVGCQYILSFKKK